MPVQEFVIFQLPLLQINQNLSSWINNNFSLSFVRSNEQECRSQCIILNILCFLPILLPCSIHLMHCLTGTLGFIRTFSAFHLDKLKHLVHWHIWYMVPSHFTFVWLIRIYHYSQCYNKRFDCHLAWHITDGSVIMLQAFPVIMYIQYITPGAPPPLNYLCTCPFLMS